LTCDAGGIKRSNAAENQLDSSADTFGQTGSSNRAALIRLAARTGLHASGDLLQNRLRCNAKASVGFCCTTRLYSDGLNPGGTASMSEFQGQRACDGVMPLEKK
jgi:hypothetical protein